MQKLKIGYITMFIGAILLISSWYLSYPVSIDSPYDFAYNHFSYLYWVSLALLLLSFFIVAIETKNNTLRWGVTVGTFLLINSRSFFSYMIRGSDAHYFRGLTEYFISNGNLGLTSYQGYFQWPNFFILNKVTTSIMGIDLLNFEFILYGVLGFLVASFLYFYASKVTTNAYIAVTVSFILLAYFFNFQWAPFTLAISLLLLLLHLESISDKREIFLLVLIVFISITFTQILVPLFFIIFSAVMYFLEKKKKYLNFFFLSLLIYCLIMSYNLMLPFYANKLTSFAFLDLLTRVEQVTSLTAAPRPYIDVISQFFSRAVTITIFIITGIGSFYLLIKKRFRKLDYALFLTGLIFAGGLLISFESYSNSADRAFLLIVMPASLGASYIIMGKFKKYLKPIFLILILLFTFVVIHKTFYDEQIFFQTEREYLCTNFMIENSNWSNSFSVLSHYRVRNYIQTKTPISSTHFGTDFTGSFPDDATTYDYVLYTVGLGKSYLRFNYSIEESINDYETNYNLIYSSGDFGYVFQK